MRAVDHDGTATIPLLAPRRRAVDLVGRVLIIHEGPDRYGPRSHPGSWRTVMPPTVQTTKMGTQVPVGACIATSYAEPGAEPDTCM